jgi:hypothetical protein
MKINKLMLVAVMTVTTGVAGLTPAKSDIVWDFTPLSNSDIGASHTFTSSGITITAAGFTNTTFGTTVDLYSKNLGGGETGIGLVNDPSGQNEITGTNLIRIDFTGARSAGVTGFSFQMNSTTGGEAWLVEGSNVAGSGYSVVASSNDEALHLLTGAAGSFAYYAFLFNTSGSTGGSNVLLHEVDGVATVPLPGALPLFATGLGFMGLLGWRKKRKPATIAA